jgi:6-phosphogluconolactonase (cycloisomerase 2 family)
MSTPIVLMGDVTGGKLYYPSGIAVNPTSQYAYVALQEKSRVNQYSMGADGTLSALTPSTVVSGDTANGGNGPVSIAIDPSGKWAYVANGSSNTLSQYSIGADGTFSALTPFLVATGGKTGAGSASDVKIASTSSGEYVYVANYFDGTIAQYSINPTTGILSQLTPFLASTSGTYALSIAVHPTGKFAYVAILTGSPNAVVAQFTIDQSTGELLAMTPPTVSAGGAGAASITVEASGKYAYATSGNTGWGSYSVAQYTIDQTTGALTLMNNATVTSGFGPGGIVTVGK